MELVELIYLALTTIFLILAYQVFRSKITKRNNPPSPPSLPFVGHLHLLKPPLHRTFHELSLKYGPVISFKFGAHPAVIVSSSSAAEECFTKNDVVLANRPDFLTLVKYLNYNNSTISSASYGDHWRNLRRIGATDIFSPLRLSVFLSTRQDEVFRLLKKLGWKRTGQDESFGKVELRSVFTDLTFNVIMRMVAGKRYYRDDEVTNREEAGEFKQVIDDIFNLSGVGNREDYLPLLRWVGGGKFEKTVKEVAERADRFLQRLIEEHRNKEDETSGGNSTMIDHLLFLQESQPEYYSDTTIKGLVLVMLLAGTDTSAVTMEWVMANLVNHPEILEKAKNELDVQIGQERLVNESDLPNLHYLQNVISETLRLYPSVPLLLPHYSSDDCTIGGYHVPRHTMVMINAWAIHRDPTLWADPEAFRPERFDDEAAKEGHKVMSFGLGRRACPGAGMAHRVVGLTLASLIQCFEWKRISEEMVDMAEGKGTTMPKAKPLDHPHPCPCYSPCPGRHVSVTLLSVFQPTPLPLLQSVPWAPHQLFFFSSAF